MYTSTFLSLNTALSGVEVAQEQLDTTGENISNANTPDYERQNVNTGTIGSLILPAGGFGRPLQLGAGVEASSITNQDNPYLNAAWRQQNASTSAADTTQTYTTQLETALDEPSNSAISAQLQQFWKDWNTLADNATGSGLQAAQQAVVQDANTLADSFNALSNEISGSGSGSILSQATDQYNSLMGSPASPDGPGEIYTDSQNIADLNQQIVAQSANGGNPNALIDQRNAYIDDLSSMGNVTVVNNSDGSVNVSFGGVPDTTTTPPGTTPVSQLLVDGSQGSSGNDFNAWQTQFTTQATAFASSAYATANPTTAASALAASFGGTAGALIGLTGYPVGAAGTATIEGTLGQAQAQLDAVANDLGQNVNNPDIAGVPTALSIALFGTSTSQTFTASTLAVNPSLLSDPSQLPVGASTGDNSIALAEASVGSEQGITVDGTNYPGTPFAGTDYPTSAYAAFVQSLGSTAQAANQNDQTQSALQTQLTNQRISAEGVDLSEEMTNLIEEQQAYEASAKVMNTFGTMMDSLMTIVGQ